MAMQLIDLSQLQAKLTELIERAGQDRPRTASLFQLMYNTGLRIREVLQVDRWTDTGTGFFAVHLEKGEGTREIAQAQVPASLLASYIGHLPFTLETYSAVNNTFKYYGPGLIFGDDTRPTTCHAFRYQYMKQLSADGLTVAQVAAIMGHMNQANTAKYIQDSIFSG